MDNLDDIFTKSGSDNTLRSDIIAKFENYDLICKSVLISASSRSDF